MKAALLAPWVGAALLACSTGEGSGSVTSDRLVVGQCWDGPFDLQPTFFASDPFANTQQIRIQRGDRPTGVSDGAALVITDVAHIRKDQLGVAIPLGLPVGVDPPGFPPRVEANPPQVSLTLYLYATCHVQNGAVYSVGGSIVFDSLFSGDRNENNAADRLTEAHFEATVADPREGHLLPDTTTGQVQVEYPKDRTSTVKGSFRFFFQRGQPAQPFP
jgi:hypothetical protein